jgi:phage-related protein
MSAPTSHVTEGEKLTADALVDLYQMSLVDDVTVFRFKNNNTVSWQGNTYEGMACQISGDRRSADIEESRATLQIMNPVGVFNLPAMNGDLDLAVLTRKRILREHLEDDINIFQQRMWYVGQVKELISGQSITLELRNMSEGPNFQIPVRMYTPPEFPLVTL